jgi:hypothetical protein
MKEILGDDIFHGVFPNAHHKSFLPRHMALRIAAVALPGAVGLGPSAIFMRDFSHATHRADFSAGRHVTLDGEKLAVNKATGEVARSEARPGEISRVRGDYLTIDSAQNKI